MSGLEGLSARFSSPIHIPTRGSESNLVSFGEYTHAFKEMGKFSVQ